MKTILTTAFALSCFAALSLGAPSDKPNILVIMTDEHNAGVLGCYGNRIVQTPNMDRLAARGIAFDAAYTNSPLCVPSRLSFTAGKYLSRVGAWNNNCKLPADIPSLPRVMNAAGYESYLCGKMHYDRSCRYGFTEIGGNMNNATMDGRGTRRAADDLTTSSKLAARFAEFSTGETSSVIEHDRKVTAGTVEFLRNRKPTNKPFFLLAGYLAPHFPLVVPEKYWANYRDKVPMPVIPPGCIDSLPLNYKLLRVAFEETNVDAATVKKGRELYYGLTQWVDEEVGKTLEALQASGLADNTVVIYTADHGENMGEHGMWWKSCVYDSAAHIPLIVSWPKRWPAPQRRAGACSLVDVVQTIVELGGGSAPADWNGTSLCAYMDDAAAPWKDQAVTEYYAHHVASGIAMLRKGTWKYVYHTIADEKHPAVRELYDLKADPGEFRNLANDPAQQQRIAEMHAMLVKELGEAPDATEQRCRADIARGYQGVAKQPKKGKQAKAKEE